MAQIKNKIYQLKVSLKNAKPPIWRTILVHSKTKLPVFHEILQVVMGWDNYHLYQFFHNGRYYGIPDEYGELEDASKMRLSDILKWEKSKVHYTYDFGDDWEHVITLQKILEPEVGRQYPVCLKGSRACPPEDCGGIWGYMELLETISDPEHPEYEEMREWCGEDFDPEHFDTDAVGRIFYTSLLRLLLIRIFRENWI